ATMGSFSVSVAVGWRSRHHPLGERAHPGGPAPWRAHGVAHRLPTGAVTLDVAVLELNPRAIGANRREAHFDLAGLVVVGLELPLHTDVPTDHKPARRLVREHSRPAALAAVDAAVVDMAADAGLEHHPRQLGLEDVVGRIPPAPDVLSEDMERAVDWRL